MTHEAPNPPHPKDNPSTVSIHDMSGISQNKLPIKKGMTLSIEPMVISHSLYREDRMKLYPPNKKDKPNEPNTNNNDHA
jgi:methionine aminopeptidase